MRVLTIPCAILLFVVFPGCTGTQDIPKEKQYLVAGLPLKNATGEKQYSAQLQTVRDKILSELFAGKRMRLVERERIDAVLTEKQLMQTGITDTNKAIEAGALLGAEAVLLTELTKVQFESFSRTAVIAHKKVFRVTASLSARIIAVKTGEILATAQISDEFDQEEKTAMFVLKTGEINKDAAIAAALVQAAGKLAYKLSASMPAK